MFLGSSSAFAQFDVQDCNSDVNTCSVILSSTSSSSTALAGGLIFTAILSADQTATMQKFLRRNRVALIADISVGSGELLHDFAFLLGVPKEDVFEFGKRLRKKRAIFNRKMKGAIKDHSRAQKFVVWVVGLKNA